MAIWKSGKTLVLGRGIVRSKYERQPTRTMISQSIQFSKALNNAGINIGDSYGLTRVGMAFANAVINKQKRRK